MKTVGVFGIQVAAWTSFIVLAPLVIYFQWQDVAYAQTLFHMLKATIIPCMIVYFLNYYIFVPCFLFRGKHRKVLFFGINLISVGMLPCYMIYKILIRDSVAHSEWVQLGVTAAIVMIAVLEIGAAGIAVALRNYLHTQKMKLQLNVEKRQHSEAELEWLKNQLNPHFLFNSLNNISSLIYLDTDKAQDSIGRLSDLLRYAIYESEKKLVPLQKEIEFIRNYIELMSLRCNDNIEIGFDFSCDNPNMQVPPLVLISFIENAFKHGISGAKKSFIKISIAVKEGVLTFICENSNHAKSGSDHSGKGIGLTNTRKRLDMIYGDRYVWNQYTDEAVFKVEIIISLL